MTTNLLVDLNNFVVSLRHSKFKPVTSARKKERFFKETLFLESLRSILFHASKLKASRLVIASDSKNCWRKDIYPEYKDNHKIDQIEDFYHQDTIDVLNLLADFFRDYTGAYVLSYPRAEGDDIIGVWVTESYGANNVILSTDRDYVQLVSDTTKLYSPVQGVYRETEDAGFDLFVKCIRGDKNDNIRSAYPKVRETVLKKAWENEIDFLNLVETVHPGGKVGDLLSFNASLIDLTAQPDAMRAGIVSLIENYVPAKYKESDVLRFMGEIGLKGGTADILSGREVLLRNSPVFRSQ